MEKVYKPQVSADCYEKHGFHPLRIESITEQLRQICYSGYKNILEIGVGKGLLKHFLKPFSKISHTGLDIAEDLHPDYVGSVTKLPFAKHQFDLTICCEVLEHLPFEDFLPALKEIRRVTRHKVVISLPDKRRHFGFAVRLARFGWFKCEWNPTRRRYARSKLRFKGHHYWEIGCKGTLARDVVRNIREAGFKVEKQYRLWKHPWHSFFVLQT